MTRLIDGSKALHKAVTQTFGPAALIQRCQVHKQRNVLDHLPDSQRAAVQAILQRAYRATELAPARRLLHDLARRRGHLVITAPTGGSAGVMPSLVYGLLEVRKVDRQEIRDGMFAAAAIGYLCKHHAALSAAEGGCQAEIGVASSMAAALTATAYDAPSLVVENAAESALEHHLGMTCDPVAGYVQVPCIERCAFGAVKALPANRATLAQRGALPGQQSAL